MIVLVGTSVVAAATVAVLADATVAAAAVEVFVASTAHWRP